MSTLQYIFTVVSMVLLFPAVNHLELQLERWHHDRHSSD